MTPRELGVCSEVCTQWNQCESDQSLWAQFFSSANLTFPGGFSKNIKSLFNRIVIKSRGELLEKIRDFVSRIDANTNAVFCCRYFNNKAMTTIRVGKGQPQDPYFGHPAFLENPQQIEGFVYRDMLSKGKAPAPSNFLEIDDPHESYSFVLTAASDTGLKVSGNTICKNGVKVSILEQLPHGNRNNTKPRVCYQIFDLARQI